AKAARIFEEYAMPSSFQELLELSQRDKKGLTFYVNGQTIPGVVTKILGSGGEIEVRNQLSGRIILRLDRIDAIALNYATVPSAVWTECASAPSERFGGQRRRYRRASARARAPLLERRGRGPRAISPPGRGWPPTCPSAR